MTNVRTFGVAVKSNLGRSLLTILGIVIGIVAIVVVIALGQAARIFIIDQVEGVGGRTLILRPGRQPQGPTDIAESILSDSLTPRDIVALRQPGRVDGLEAVEPAVLVPGSVSYQNQVFRPVTLGWSGEALTRFFQIYPEEGDVFTDEDIRAHAKVAVIGAHVKDELFGESSAVGEFVKIKGVNLRVIGVLPAKGQVSVLNLDDVVIIPSTTAQKDVMGIDFYHEVFLSVADGFDIDAVAVDVRETLRDLHGINDPSKDDFFVLAQKDIVERVGVITQALTLFLVAIASISLLVGGIGIMNIMLVSVTERTREIGLRKALGATNEDILRQFLFESLLLTVTGGVLGVVIAFAFVWLASFVVRTYFGLFWPFVLPWYGVALGVGMAGFVGVVFGLYPARKASRRNPIEALRYE